MSETTVLPVREVSVKLVGVLGSAAGRREIMLPLHRGSTVQQLVSELLRIVNKKLFRELLVDAGTDDPRPNAIILIDDQDCNVRDSLETEIEPGTRVTIIPVAHGG